MDLSKHLKLAKEAAFKAGGIIASYYGKNLEVTHKSAVQPLTKADLEANDAIREILKKNFPDYGWLSEEDTDNLDRQPKSHLWIVDPLDGTRDFINHNPEFAVSIGLAVDKKSILGIVYNPITEELFHAVKGHGAFLNDKKISVKKRQSGEKMELIVSRSEYNRGDWDALKGTFKISSTGGCAYKMAKIAEGVADGTFTHNPKSEWDVCAGEIIVQEAGGIVTKIDGKPIVYNRELPIIDALIYCNCKEVHEKILSVI